MRIARANRTVPKPNKNLTLDEFRPVLMAILFVAMFVSIYHADQEAAKEPLCLSNAPSYSTEFEDRKSYSIDTLVEFENRIYILPSSSQGFVQVYDLEGTYQYSMFFLEHRNGGFSLGTDGEYLYVKDKNHNIFIFHDDEFAEYQNRDQAEKRPAEMWKSTPGYEIRGRDLWRVLDGCEVLVIQNLISSRTGENIRFLSYVLLIGIFWLVGSWLKRRRTGI